MEDSLNKPLSIKTYKVTLPRRAAGHKMTTKVPIARASTTVSEVRNSLMYEDSGYETINYVYIINQSGKLKGVVNLKDIFRSKFDKKMSDLMETKLVKARIETDYKKAAHLAIKNNIKAMPLVDHKGNLVGVLASDQVLEIVEHESHNDLLKLSGIILSRGKLPTGHLVGTPFSAYVSRAPWILMGLFGAMFTARIITNFDELISQHIILASFIPLVAYVANAVGNQTQTLLIRDLATQPKFSLTAYATKQYITTTMIGISCLIVLMGISYLSWADMYIGLIVGTSVIVAILVSTTLAITIPKILVKFDLDPATGAGPFSTVLQDFLSVTIYLFTASILI